MPFFARMGTEAKKIRLSPRVLGLLEHEVNRKQLEKHYYERMQIILKSNEGLKTKDIASILGIDIQKVARWRNRWDFTLEDSLAFEQGEDGNGVSDKKLLEKIKSLLSDHPRPGHPPKLTDSDIVRLQALACEKPEDHGLPFSAWTHIELSKQAKKIGIEISPSWYGIILKKRIETA